ncbi:MAG: class I SAM-dependent methyltransferase [Oligoflexia bacterium]|nr:class I SAM-dependent methyltransferase [Oligoflexia bacterium]
MSEQSSKPNLGFNWDDRYEGSEFFYGDQPNDFLVKCAPRLTSRSKILCLGEGEGRNAVYLAKLGHNVTATDQSALGLKKLETLAETQQVKVATIQSDISDFDLGEKKWDVIVSIWFHLPESLRRPIHRKVVEALKPGGHLILEAYTPNQLKYQSGGPKEMTMLMSKDSLIQELNGMRLEISELEREIHEGKGHNGLSAVVQVFGTKG